MISTETMLSLLFEHRRDKLAMVLLLGFMGGDSVTEAWARLDDFMPTIDKLERESQRHRGRSKEARLDIDHDLALRVRDIAHEIEPWLRQIAELETAHA